MVRIWSILTLLFACCVMVNTVRAQDAPAKKHKGPEARFDALEAAAKHDPLKGELTKDEFVAAIKATAKDPKQAEHAESLFNKISKADETKVTKAEFVKFAKDHAGKGKKKDQ